MHMSFLHRCFAPQLGIRYSAADVMLAAIKEKATVVDGEQHPMRGRKRVRGRERGRGVRGPSSTFAAEL